MEKTSNGKNAEWDKTLNEKTLNGTKRRIKSRKDKYIKIIFGFLLLQSDNIGTTTY